MTTSILATDFHDISDGDLADLRERERRILLAASIEEQDKGALIVRCYKDTPFYEVKWRDFTGTQRKRRLGRAWVERGADGEWTRRRGRAGAGHLDGRRAYALMPGVILSHEEELLAASPNARNALFEDAASAWMEHLRTEKRAKPSTLVGYKSLLAKPSGTEKARIMRAFGGHTLVAIKTSDVRRFLAKLDREDISARTVNIHRQILHAIFEFARREDTFRLASNPVAGTTKRPEEGALPIETFEPEEVRRIAEVARAGLHRRKPGYKHSEYSPAFLSDWKRINDQDAALFTFAAFTGLRLGELLALRWQNVDFGAEIITVSRAISAGEETSTKSRKSRIVPLAAQAIEVLRSLKTRKQFTGRNDFVFCRRDGGRQDYSAIRKRFVRAQKEAGVRVRRFHDLRHTFGSLAIREFDVVAVKEMMGHSKLSTTERYLHSKPRPSDAAKLTAAFAGEAEEPALALDE